MFFPKLPIPMFQEEVETLVRRHEEMRLYQRSQLLFGLGSFNNPISSAVREPSMVHTPSYPIGSISQSSTRRGPSLFEHVAGSVLANFRVKVIIWASASM